MSCNKLKTMEELVSMVENFKKDGKVVVLAHGVFDFLHHGYLHYIKEARKLGDVLILSVIADKFVKKGLEKTIFDEHVRAENMAGFEWVDFVVLCQNIGPWDIIKKLKPDKYAKEGDFGSVSENPDSTVSWDKDTIKSVGGEFCLTKSLPVSARDFIDRFKKLPDGVVNFLNDFKTRYNTEDIILRVEKVRKLNVLVIGETIVDEYRFTEPLGKPNKAHIVCVEFKEKEEYAGGAIALANHIASVCNKVSLLSYLGEMNLRENFIKNSLCKNISPEFIHCPDQRTITKRRFLTSGSNIKLFEEYEFNREFLPKDQEKKAGDFLEKNLSKHDLVVVIDYGHGFLSKRLINIIASNAKYLAVNAQTNSGNAGFNYITKYPRADFVCLDEQEVRLALQDNISDVRSLIKKLHGRLMADKIIVTLGRKGSLGYDENSGFVSVPSLATSITDAVGSGDTFLAIAALFAVSNFSLELVSFIGNIAGSVAVNILGNKNPVGYSEIIKEIGYLLD